MSRRPRPFRILCTTPQVPKEQVLVSHDGTVINRDFQYYTEKARELERVGAIRAAQAQRDVRWASVDYQQMCELHIREFGITENTSRAAELWSLLHNGCSPEGRWTPESKSYYERVAAVFDRTRRVTTNKRIPLSKVVR